MTSLPFWSTCGAPQIQAPLLSGAQTSGTSTDACLQSLASTKLHSLSSACRAVSHQTATCRCSVRSAGTRGLAEELPWLGPWRASSDLAIVPASCRPSCSAPERFQDHRDQQEAHQRQEQAAQLKASLAATAVPEAAQDPVLTSGATAPLEKAQEPSIAVAPAPLPTVAIVSAKQKPRVVLPPKSVNVALAREATQHAEDPASAPPHRASSGARGGARDRAQGGGRRRGHWG